MSSQNIPARKTNSVALTADPSRAAARSYLHANGPNKFEGKHHNEFWLAPKSGEAV